MLQSWLTLKHLIRHKSIENFVFLSFTQGSNILISLITVPVVTRTIGVEQFGLVTVCLSIAYLLNVGVSYGYHLSGPREVAINHRNKASLSETFSEVISSKILLATSILIVVSLLIFFTPVFRRYDLILLLSLPLLFSEAVFPLWFMQGLERMRLLTFMNILAKLIYLFLLIFLVGGPEDSHLINFFLGGSALLVNIALVGYIKTNWQLSLHWVSIRKIVSSWRKNFYLFLSSLSGHIAISSGVIILSFFAGDLAVGMYGLAEKVVIILRMFPVLITQAIYPNASRLYASDRVEFYSFLKRSYFMALSASFILSVFSFLLAPVIIRFLSGEDLPHSVLILKTLSFIPFLSCLNLANMILVLVTANNKVLFKSTWIVTLIMISICSVLSYLYGGLGLAMGLLLTELLTFVIQLIFNFKNIAHDTSSFYAFAFGRHHIS